ncbi:MFS transporter, ACS family, hexuronate transporter [Lutibacter agarilyticus]|uniref:MFS transporter, ACS family, hexuronate transporter n=1 Tax=Lutibacter agarilyticus TaxID=1109740 RepID=A0A238YRX8_9FLAO|nr:MFS transporter [Lutibacter agarilyticus]SNR73770.1 MFS transporter, ACS family, hexuronate transporter [Lutibacter agarilyticus]
MKIKGLRWVIIGLIFLATVINYIDRSALAIMWGNENVEGSISQSLGLTKSDYSLILNIFMVAYALGQLFSGKLFDKVGTRVGYVISIGVWGLSSFFHSMARGMFSLAFLRSTLGLSEAGNWPGGVKSNAEWFPIKERAIAQGLFNAGASIGSVIAPPFIATLFVAYGWRITFMVIGSFGILWIIPWLLINKSGPKTHPWITKEEQKYIVEGQSVADQNATSETKGKSLKEILSHKESWAIVIGRFFLEPIWWLFVGWMPIYLFDVYGFNVKEVGMFAWVPYVGAAIGSIAGGYVSGQIIAKTNSIDKGRKTTIFIGGVIMLIGLIATVLFADSAEIFVAIVFFVLFGFQFAISNVQTLPSDFFSGKSVGSLAGLGGMVGVFSVIIMNFLIPVIAEVSYTPIFIAIAVFVPLGVGAIYFFARDIKSVEE